MRKSITGNCLNLLLLVSTLFVFSCSNMINDMKMMGAAKSEGEIWLECLDSEDFEKSKDNILPEKGFELFKEELEEDENGTIIKRVYYKRIRVKYSFDPNGGKWHADDSSVKEFEFKYGYDVVYPLKDEEPYLNKVDDEGNEYIFDGWDIEIPGIATEDKLFTAKWVLVKNSDDDSDPTKANYTVLHIFEAANKTENDETKQKLTFAGEIGSLTAAKPLTLVSDEFEIPLEESIEQKEIKKDGSTTITIMYYRKKVTLTFKVIDGKWADGTTEDKVFADLKAGSDFTEMHFKTNAEKPKHNSGDATKRFGGWNNEGEEAPYTVPSKDSEYVTIWAAPAVDYKVEHYFQNVNLSETLSDYKIDANLTEIKTGTLNNESKAEAKSITGFTARPFSQVTLVEQEEVILIKIYYNRVKVKVTLDPKEGLWPSEENSNPVTIETHYGVPVTYPDYKNVTKEHYIYKGWKEQNDNEILKDLPSLGPDTNKTYLAEWYQNEAIYQIYYYFEPLEPENVYKLDPDKIETKYGIIGTTTNVTAPKVEGFTLKEIKQTEIKGEIDKLHNIVRVYYTRNTVKITFNPNGGKWKDLENGTQVKEMIGRYGATMTDPGEPSPSHSDNKFVYWAEEGKEVEIPKTFPGNDVLYTAIWNYKGSSYTVKYYFEKVEAPEIKSNDDYVCNEEMTKKVNFNDESLLGTLTEEYAPEVTGFNALPFEQKTISAGGLTTVEIFYDRILVSIVYNANGGKFIINDTETAAYEVKGKYEAPLQAPVTPTYDSFHVYTGAWINLSDEVVSLPETFPAENITFKVHWTVLPETEIKGEGIFTNVDLNLEDCKIENGKIKVVVKHPLENLVFTDVRIKGKKITLPASVTPTKVLGDSLNGGTTANVVCTYSFEVNETGYTSGSGDYLLEVCMKNGTVDYTARKTLTKN